MKSSMILYLFLGLALLLAGFLAFAATQPAQFEIKRSTTIEAPASTIFALIEDFHQWQAWSPWAKMDPNAKNTFSGPATGPGSTFRWDGNNQVGTGIMTIEESRGDEYLRLKLEFLKPFAAVNTAVFRLEPSGDGTRITWSMSGTNAFIGKVMGLLINCDKMVGGQFEQGLASIKAIAEAKK
jgi:hypothetical protein